MMVMALETLEVSILRRIFLNTDIWLFQRLCRTVQLFVYFRFFPDIRLGIWGLASSAGTSGNLSSFLSLLLINFHDHLDISFVHASLFERVFLNVLCYKLVYQTDRGGSIILARNNTFINTGLECKLLQGLFPWCFRVSTLERLSNGPINNFASRLCHCKVRSSIICTEEIDWK